MVKNLSVNMGDARDPDVPKYKKAPKKDIKQKTLTPETIFTKDEYTLQLERKVDLLEAKVTALTLLFEANVKNFDAFLSALRQSELQDVRAKEKAYQLIKSNQGWGGLKLFMDESRRSNLQMISYSSKQIGVEYENSKIRYEKKMKTRNRNKKTGNANKTND